MTGHKWTVEMLETSGAWYHVASFASHARAGQYARTLSFATRIRRAHDDAAPVVYLARGAMLENAGNAPRVFATWYAAARECARLRTAHRVFAMRGAHTDRARRAAIVSARGRRANYAVQTQRVR